MYTIAYAAHPGRESLEISQIDRELKYFTFGGRQVLAAGNKDCARVYEILNQRPMLVFTGKRRNTAQKGANDYFKRFGKRGFEKIAQLCGLSWKGTALARYGRMYYEYLKSKHMKKQQSL